MAQPALGRNYQIIDLTSDNEDDPLPADEIASLAAKPVSEPTNVEEKFDLNKIHRYGQSSIHQQDIVELAAIPDTDVPPSNSSQPAIDHAALNDGFNETEIISESVCLQLVLDVFPDVSVDHVLGLIKAKTTDQTCTKFHSERIVNELLEGIYPKEADVMSKKRRREDGDEVSDFENNECGPGVPTYDKDALDLLKDEFRNIPVRHITNVFKDQKTLFKTYIVLEGQVRSHNHISRANANPTKPRNKRGTELVLIERGSQLPRELRAARKKVENEAVKRRKMEESDRAEEANLRQARMNNQMGECQCCFTECPLNRMVSCDGKDMHLFCMNCPKQYIETEMGQSKCRPVCFASTECKGAFSRQQLQQVLSEKTFERLEHMQQQQDLSAADLDFLSECPFCDFMMECPPVNEDKEFRCQNTRCSKTSCRLCQKKTHIPLSCEEAQKEGRLTMRHVVEEAMSAALIRKCNNCNHPFVKDYGCNKMTCSHCSNVQCYICSKNVDSYEHFGDISKGRCALHDNVEDVHEQAVKKAADEATAKVKAENPNLADADLMIQVSDRVKQAELTRRHQAIDRMNAFPYHMAGDQLVHRPGFLGGAPPPPRAVVQPPLQPFAGIGDMPGAVYDGFDAAFGMPDGLPDPLAGLHPQPLAHFNPLPPPQLQIRVDRQFQVAVNPLARVDPAIQAAQNQFQQVRYPNRARVENRVHYERAVQAERNVLDAERADGRHRMQDVARQYDEPRRQDMEMRRIVGFDGPPANVGNAGVGAGAGAGAANDLAFAGLDANRAVRRQELNRWFDEQLANSPQRQ